MPLAPFSKSIIIACVILPVLAALAVILRFQARRVKRQAPFPDDYIVVVALVINFALAALTIYGACDAGLGRTLGSMTQVERIKYAKVLFAHQFISSASISIVKISILLFYKRIFTSPGFWLSANVMIAIVMGWWASQFFGTMFSSTPISAQWTNVGYYRVNYPAFLIGAGVTGMAIDIATLCLPLFVIRRLQISRKKKVYLAGIFWLGLFCVVASIVRLVYYVQFMHDYGTPAAVLSINAARIILWAVIEACMSAVAACIPTLGPLLRERGGASYISSLKLRFFSGGSGTESADQKKAYKISQQSESSHARRAWQELNTDTTVTAGAGTEFEMHHVAIPKGERYGVGAGTPVPPAHR